MKIGILTFHYVYNYGGVLQAYGLQKYLQGLGHDVYVINYRPERIKPLDKRDNHRDWLSRNPKACIKRFWQFFHYRGIRHDRFDNFNKFIAQRFRYIDDSPELIDSLDTVIVGSDQIWSAKITGGTFDERYFGVGINTHVISYAASHSGNSLSQYEKDGFLRLLGNIDNISVREEKFKELLNPICQRPIEVVVDPTILAGACIYSSIAKLPTITKPYVLVYEITRHKETFDFASKIASKLNADIIELTNGMTEKHMPWMREGASPEEFLGYFKNAEVIVTTSFHGTAFSILFKKSFYTLRQNNPSDIRMENLLSKIGFLDRMVPMNSNCELSEPNYDRIEERLDELVASSKNFLNNNLNRREHD